ncbi:MULTISPECIES: thioredoxin family protein [Kordiimonas]|jgi:thiol-disulfide isomerase/thioredoxin|uniref:Thioredoxin n=1 Tax=Kordiimonas lacus TaxID=637679 RepID=A0A1G7CB09_9PROT|nr:MULTISPECIES: thioredoxin family protein [Kordiimonas]SDE35585.1 Thioredoxin [Kordiimonas lacus]
MKSKMQKIWATVGVTGLIALALFGNLIYMNLRDADPILPGWEEYSPARFAELMARDEPVMVEIYASWCPTCLLQHRAFETLQKEGRAPRIRAVRVDFDRDRSFIEEHGYRGTGLIVVFRNGREVERAAGLTSADDIAAFLVDQGIS